MKLFQYQEECIEDIMLSTEKYLYLKNNKNLLVKAVTGAGKTVIATEYIRRVCNAYENICFVWLSLGTGGLHSQSYDSLKNNLPTNIKVKDLSEVLNQKELQDKDVLVVNWEKLNMKDKQTREYTNVAMRKDNPNNFPNLLNNTHLSNRKVILLIDESHHTAHSDTSQEIKELINPVLTIEITATPSNSADYTQIIEIETGDVIKEGVIKKSIKINSKFTDSVVGNVIKTMIVSGLEKRIELKNYYQIVGTKINPLCLIQLPSADDVTKDLVFKILEEEGYTTQNGKVAVWLDGQTENKQDIEKIDNEVEILVFKQAIAIGWDCPRSQVLVKLRDTKSATLDIQTLGRILRMPERKHYQIEDLNHAYVYIDEPRYDLKVESYQCITDKIIEIKSEFKDDIQHLIFNSFERKVILPKVTTQFICQKLDEIIEKDFRYNTQDISIKIGKGTVEANDLTIKADTKKCVKIEEHYELYYNKEEVHQLYKKMFKKIDNLNSLAYMLGASTFILQRFPYLKEEENYHYLIYKILLNDKEKFMSAFKKIQNIIRNDIKNIEINPVQYMISSMISVPKGVNQLEMYDKCAYEKCLLTKSYPEQHFQTWLEQNPNVKCWVKNGNRGNFLSLPYENENKNLLYPDYIVVYKNNVIGIYEVKGKGEQNIDINLEEKEKALLTYIRENNFVGGIVEVDVNSAYTYPDLSRCIGPKK